jgi:hypothetical protein
LGMRWTSVFKLLVPMQVTQFLVKV